MSCCRVPLGQQGIPQIEVERCDGWLQAYGMPIARDRCRQPPLLPVYGTKARMDLRSLGGRTRVV